MRVGRPAYPEGVSEPDILLFTYGTLRLPDVQRETFGRLITGDDDVLAGYTVDYVDIADPHVVALSDRAVHPILRATGDPRDKVVGTALRITQDELDAADEYEVEDYRRVRVTLASGRQAWVYVEH